MVQYRIAVAVYRFTRGHPGSTRTIINAIADRPDLASDLRSLLSETLAGADVPLARRLLNDLLRGVPDEWLETLITLSAARDRDQARRTRSRRISGRCGSSPSPTRPGSAGR
jgi:hypothetical protein